MDVSEVAMHLTIAVIQKQGLQIATSTEFDKQAQENVERVAAWYKAILKGITARTDEEREESRKAMEESDRAMARARKEGPRL